MALNSTWRLWRFSFILVVDIPFRQLSSGFDEVLLGVLRHGTGSQGLGRGCGQARWQGDGRAMGSNGLRLEGVATAQRWLPASNRGQAGKAEGMEAGL